jgi:hypothetical protein
MPNFYTTMYSAEPVGSPHLLADGNPVETEVSYFKNKDNKAPSGEISLLRFVETVKSGKYRETIERIRSLNDMGFGPEADEVKTYLPAVSLSGTVTEGLRKNAFAEGRFKHSGFLQVDFDAEDFHPRDPVEIKEVLTSDEHVQAVFLSPMLGVKAIIRVPVCENNTQHHAVFLAAEAYFLEKYGLSIDASTKDPGRLCFVSFDPDAFIKESPATVLSVTFTEIADEDFEAPNKKSTSKQQCAADNTATSKHAPLPLETIKDILACIPSRPDYDQWLKISSAVWAATGDEATGTALLKEWSPEETPCEYKLKYKDRLTKITVGTLIHYAREHGFRFPAKEIEDGCIRIPDDVFPVPSGEIEYSTAGEIIFSSIAPTHSLFVRGGSAQEVTADGDEPAHFAPLSPERFCSLIENYGHRVARREWQEGKDGDDKGKHVWRSTRLPLNASKILLLSDTVGQHLPQVRQLAACPILTKEGKVIGRGYHAHAGGTYVTGDEIPQEIPVGAAVTALLGLLDDFNFVTPADRSRAVASFLSPALKMGGWIDDDFPMDVAEADKSQSGKTYRQKLVNRIYNEIPSAITAPRGGVGSLDETISAALIKGRPFITLDNFRGKLDSTILEQAIRGMKRVSCRALRISAEVDTQPFNWQLSTNGAEFTRDIANRSIITRIRKQRPDYRFKDYPEGSLEAHVATKQPFYLGAVFSVISEWSQNGCPKTGETRHDFRGWCQALDWIVQNIFMLAPLLDGHQAEQARTANPALQWLREVTMAARGGNRLYCELTTAQLVGIAEDAAIEFPGNAASKEEPPQRAGKLLGKVFRESDGQPVTVDGLTVTRTERSVHIEGRGYEMQKIYTITIVAE